MPAPRERPADGARREAGACVRCRARGALLAELGGPLDRVAADPGRLAEALELHSAQLIAALGGRRAQELRALHDRMLAAPPAADAHDVHSCCRHGAAWPLAPAGVRAPFMLYSSRPVPELVALAARPSVALIGSTRASDYGREVARALARGLSAAGITVVTRAAPGIARAAHAGAAETDGGALLVLAGGLRTAGEAARARARAPAAVSELPPCCSQRRWSAIAADRTAAALARVTVLVEAGERPSELFAARHASALGRAVAAVPGRVGSPLSSGTNGLLADGAQLVRGAADVLELIGEAPVGTVEPARAARVGLEPCLRRTLELVGCGCDSAECLLARERCGHSELLARIAELELRGLLVRGDGGRYVLAGAALV